MSVIDPAEALLVASAKGGDRFAFSDLITQHYPSAYKLAKALLQDPNEAEDAVQEAAFKAWRHLSQLHAGAPFRPWLLGIVANQCRTSRRGRWWSVIRAGEVRRAPDPISDEDLMSLELRRALRRLAYDERLLLILRYYLDLPYEEIGLQFRISSKAARTRAERALKRLRPMLRMHEVTA